MYAKSVDKSLITLSIDENYSVNHPITDLKNLLDISNINKSYYFSFLKPNRYFTLSKKGIITIANQLDCDNDSNLCDTTVTYCLNKLFIIMNNFKIIIVDVLINDLNDNPPRWTNNISLSIVENTPVGTIFNIPKAVDLDRSSKNHLINYTILSDSNNLYFDIHFLSSDIAKQQPKLRIIKLIDREIVDLISVKVLLTDNGTPQLSSFGYIIVNVLDINDNYPTFPVHKQVISIKETHPLTTRIPINVSAADVDSGQYGMVFYKHSLSNSRVTKDYFNINKLKGDIYLNRKLDYEKGNRHFQFLIIAYDQGQPSLSSSMTVIINVLDINDEAPLIELRKSSHRIQLRENVKPSPNISVAELYVQDLDAGQNGKFNCSLKPQSTGFVLFFKQQLVNISIYQLVPLKSFNRELESMVNLTVYCIDFGLTKRLSSSLNISIEIVDVNDNSPQFLMPSFSFVIPELTEVGSLVGSVSAADPDAGRNSRLTYYILQDQRTTEMEYGLPFFIDNSGRIFINQLLDRRSSPAQYKFQVVVTDNGRPPLSSNVTVSVLLKDINNCAPEFNVSTLLFQVPENGNYPWDESANNININNNNDNNNQNNQNNNNNHMQTQSMGELPKTLGYIIVNDCDIGDNAEISIRLQNHLDTFRVDSKGKLKVIQWLDRERQSSYELSLVAVDSVIGGSVRHTVTCTATVTVTDINDNAPSISVQQNNKDHIMSFREHPGFNLIQVSVNDTDQGPNGQVTLSTGVGEFNSHFAVTSIINSGNVIVNNREVDSSFIHMIKLAKPLSERHQGHQILTLIATDQGIPQFSSSIQLSVIVDDAAPRTLPPTNNDSLQPSDGAANDGVMVHPNGNRILNQTVTITILVAAAVAVVFVFTCCTVILVLRVRKRHRHQYSNTATNSNQPDNIVDTAFLNSTDQSNEKKEIADHIPLKCQEMDPDFCSECQRLRRCLDLNQPTHSLSNEEKMYLISDAHALPGLSTTITTVSSIQPINYQMHTATSPLCTSSYFINNSANSTDSKDSSYETSQLSYITITPYHVISSPNQTPADSQNHYHNCNQQSVSHHQHQQQQQQQQQQQHSYISPCYTCYETGSRLTLHSASPSETTINLMSNNDYAIKSVDNIIPISASVAPFSPDAAVSINPFIHHHTSLAIPSTVVSIKSPPEFSSSTLLMETGSHLPDKSAARIFY